MSLERNLAKGSLAEEHNIMGNENPWGNNYDPEAERCCKDCGKTFKSKEGVLHGQYEFHCSPCHMWWKNTWKKVYIGVGIGAVILLLIGIFFVWRYVKKEKKWKCYKCKRKYIKEDDDDE